MRTPRYAVIMAGGKGTRFWPLSRARRPKQCLKILSRKSLIQETLHRIAPLFAPEHILVVTAADHFHEIRRELKGLPRRNFLIEPQGNNTAPCIGLAAIEISARDSNAIMTILPADHWISDRDSFCRTLRAAAELVEKQDALVTLGIRPSYPETGYGYILKGKSFKAPGFSGFRVKSFKEKPSSRRARQLIRAGSLWNGGIFTWRAATILEALRRHIPAVSQSLNRIREAARGRSLATPNPKLKTLLAREYKKMPSISIDHAVLEKAASEDRVWTLEAKFGWSDVGSWAAVHQLLPRNHQGNAGVGRWLAFKSRGCLLHSNHRLVAVLGMEDTIVVDTPDALLVAPAKRAQEVRDLVEELQQKGYGRYTVG